MVPPSEPKTERFARTKLSISIGSLVVAFLALVIAVVPSLGSPIRTAFESPSCDNPLSLRPPDVPARAVASSELPDQPDSKGHVFRYLADEAIDRNAATAWIPADRAGGVGQTLTITWAQPVDVELVCLVNGYASDAVTFVHNGTVSTVDVTTDGGTASGGFPAPVGYSQSGVTVPVRTGETTSLRITITGARSAVEQGSDPFRDTAISEVTVYAR